MGGGQRVLCVASRIAHSSYWHLPSAKAQIIKVKGSLLIHVLLVLALPRQVQLLMPADVEGDQQATNQLRLRPTPCAKPGRTQSSCLAIVMGSGAC